MTANKFSLKIKPRTHKLREETKCKRKLHNANDYHCNQLKIPNFKKLSLESVENIEFQIKQKKTRINGLKTSNTSL